MLLDAIEAISCQNVYELMKGKVFLLELIFDWLLINIINENLYVSRIRDQVFTSILNIANGLKRDREE